MMIERSLFKAVAVYLVFAMILLTLPAQGWAMFIPGNESDAMRNADLAMIQKTLESSVVKQRLMDMGLTTKESMARINSLSNEQIHQFASDLDSVQAGADDGLGLLVFLLLVAIIVVVVLEATGHRVIVR